MDRIESSLTEIENFEKKHPDFKDQIDIFKMILKAQSPILKDPKKGTTIDLDEIAFLDDLQNRSLKEGKPLISFLKPTLYDFKNLQKTFLAVLEGFEKLDIENQEIIVKLKSNASKLLPEIIEKRLQHNHTFFLSLAEKFNLSNIFFEVIADTLIQPAIKKIANNTKKKAIIDKWNKTICPICGRTPFIVVKNEEQVWQFQCIFCETEYTMNIFKCPSCENEDFKKKEFFFIKGREEFEVAYCHDCNYYFKIINMHKLKEKLPIAFEDLYTSDLDELAQKKGLKRLDDQLMKH